MFSVVVHHTRTSIFHLGHPYYTICSCLSVTLAHFQCCCFLFFSTKSLWFGLLRPRCIRLDSFPQEAWGPRVVVSETNAQNFLEWVLILASWCCHLPFMESYRCQVIISLLKPLPAILFGRLHIPVFYEASRWTNLNFMVGEIYSWNLDFCLDVVHWSLGL